MSAYSAECFKSGVKFLGLLVPLQYNDNSKSQHYLDIFEAVETDRQCEILVKPGLDKTSLQNFAYAIENDCTDHIDNWEINLTIYRKKKRYAGVGKRLSALKIRFQR